MTAIEDEISPAGGLRCPFCRARIGDPASVAAARARRRALLARDKKEEARKVQVPLPAHGHAERCARRSMLKRQGRSDSLKKRRAPPRTPPPERQAKIEEATT